MDAHGIPVRMLVTAGSTVDCSQASTLIGGIDEQYLLADKGYNSDIIRAQAKGQGMEPVIRHAKTAGSFVTTTSIFINCVIGQRVRFCISSAGAELPPTMAEIPLRSWLLFISAIITVWAEIL